MYNDYGSDCGPRSINRNRLGGEFKRPRVLHLVAPRGCLDISTPHIPVVCWGDAEGVICRPPQMVEGRGDAKSGSEKLDSEILTDEQWSGRALVTAPSILRQPQSIKCERTPVENSGTQLKLRVSVAPAYITSPKDLRFCLSESA